MLVWAINPRPHLNCKLGVEVLDCSMFNTLQLLPVGFREAVLALCDIWRDRYRDTIELID